jgi:hypothetical protein
LSFFDWETLIQVEYVVKKITKSKTTNYLEESGHKGSIWKLEGKQIADFIHNIHHPLLYSVYWHDNMLVGLN